MRFLTWSTTLEEKATMTTGNRQVAWASEKADESAKTGAIQDGAEVAERIANKPLTLAQKVDEANPIVSHLP